jgi:hypothetical protein
VLVPAVHMDKPGCLMSCQPGKNTSCAFSAKLNREIEPNPVSTIGSYDLSAKFGEEVPQLTDGRWMLSGNAFTPPMESQK